MSPELLLFLHPAGVWVGVTLLLQWEIPQSVQPGSRSVQRLWNRAELSEEWKCLLL